MGAIQAAMDQSKALQAQMDRDWNEERGVDRGGYSANENRAIEVFRKQAQELGMEEQIDAAGDVYFIYPGQDRTKPVFMTGSHPDGVPKGGRYDGVAGIIAGFAAIRMMREAGERPPQDTVVAVFRAEESACHNGGVACVGSKAVVGSLTEEFLEKAKFKDDDRTIETRMQNCGVDTDVLRGYLREGKTLYDLNQIGRFVEVHIEQNGALKKAGKNIGIVTDIRGHVRYPTKVHFEGQAAHSGATEQEDRQDAAEAMVNFGDRFYKMVRRLKKQFDLVGTAPNFAAKGAESSQVLPESEIQLEVRSTDETALKLAEKKIKQLARSVAKKYNVVLKFPEDSQIVYAAPSKMSDDVVTSLTEIAQEEGLTFLTMPSGAGHDAGILGLAGMDSSMIFIPHAPESWNPASGSYSHCIGETMTLHENDDPFAGDSGFANAVRVLKGAMMKPASNDDRTLDRPFSALPAPLAA